MVVIDDMTKPADDEDFVTIRIHRRTRRQIDKLIKQVTTGGWTALSATRNDAVTIASIVSEAVRALEQRGRS